MRKKKTNMMMYNLGSGISPADRKLSGFFSTMLISMLKRSIPLVWGSLL
uniref:Uncharacterized protein n=1 Tax=Anguilla anguilla TaxID=7936 RepID=A0A0E9SFX1_ANGAN